MLAPLEVREQKLLPLLPRRRLMIFSPTIKRTAKRLDMRGLTAFQLKSGIERAFWRLCLTSTLVRCIESPEVRGGPVLIYQKTRLCDMG
jgi:hypothetical protein